MNRRAFEDALVATVAKVWPKTHLHAGVSLTSHVSLQLFRRDQHRIRDILLENLPELGNREAREHLARREHLRHANLWDLMSAMRQPAAFAAAARRLGTNLDALDPIVSPNHPALLLTLYSGRFTLSAFCLLEHLLSRHRIPIFMYLNPRATEIWRKLVATALPSVAEYFLPMSFTRGPEDRVIERRLMRALRGRSPCVLFGFVDTLFFPIGSPTVRIRCLNGEFETSPFFARLARMGDCGVTAYASFWNREHGSEIRYETTSVHSAAASLPATELNLQVFGYAERFLRQYPWEWHSWHTVFQS